MLTDHDVATNLHSINRANGPRAKYAVRAQLIRLGVLRTEPNYQFKVTQCMSNCAIYPLLWVPTYSTPFYSSIKLQKNICTPKTPQNFDLGLRL